MDLFTPITSISLGLGLSAACGFRAFLPPLFLGIFTRADLITLGESWQWFSSDWAIGLFAAAALFEVCGYFIPWLDNLLDIISTPAAITAGTILTCASLDGIYPGLQWILALISGVGLTGTVQTSSVLLRGLSTATTGGLGNPIIAIAEDIVSIILTLTAILLPLISLILIVILLILGKRLIVKLRNHKRNGANEEKVIT